MRFLLLFLAIQLTLFGANMLSVVQEKFVLPWTSLLAAVCVKLTTWFDPTVAANGKTLWNTTTGFGVSIEPGCNGIEACIVLLAAVVAWPSSWADKAAGLAVGILTVQVLNVVRVVSLYYLGQWDAQLFHFAHAYLWQIFIMLDVLVVWLYWARWTRRHAPPSHGAEPAAVAGSHA